MGVSMGSVVAPRTKVRAPFYAGAVFNLSGSEIVFLLVAGLVVLGPERLPTAIRTVGRVYGQFKRAASGLETELKETFGDPIDEMRRSMTDVGVEFGKIDTEPSPPMRPERSRPMEQPSDRPAQDTGGQDSHPSTDDATIGHDRATGTDGPGENA